MTTNVMTSTAATAVATRPRRNFPTGKLVAWILLILVFIVILFPFWWAIRTSLSTQRDLLADPTSLMPVNFTLMNYARVLGLVDTETAVRLGGSGQTLNFALYLRNTIIVAALIVAGQTFFCALAAYAFARLHFPLREPIFYLYIAGLMVPAIVTLIPNFILIRQLRLENTFAGIVATTFLMTPFAVFFLRQFFLGINKDLEEAAKLDGAGLFTVFWRIILPISMPPLTTLAILIFVVTWNMYLWPYLIGRDEAVRVLTAAVATFRSQTPQGAPDWTGLMAASIVTMLPTLLVFLVVGRRVVNSIQFTGFK